MPTYSALQTQYPLSPRKFWKKFLPKLFFWIVLLVIIFAFGMFLSAISSSDNPSASTGFMMITMWGCLAVLALALVILVPYAIYVSAYIRRYYYDAGPDFVTIKKGVFAPAEIHVQYQKIQDVYVDQDILDRIMGLYDVHIASATVSSGIEAHIDGVDAVGAEGLKSLLLNKLKAPSAPAPLGGMPASSLGSAPQAGPVSFSEEISSRTYPIAGAWIAQQIVSSLFFSFFTTTFILIYAALPSKNSSKSLLDAFGVTVSSGVELWLIVFVIIAVLRIFYQIIWRSTYSFAFLPEYVVLKQGVIARAETHVPYRSIQDISVNQGIIERLLGLATVRIENAAAPQMVGKRVVSSALRIPGQPLAKANHLSDVVKSTVLKSNPSQTGL